MTEFLKMVFGDMEIEQTLEVLDTRGKFLISLFYLSGAEESMGCGVTRWRKPDIMRFIFQGGWGVVDTTLYLWRVTPPALLHLFT